MHEEFMAACERHRDFMDDPNAFWGWKSSPSVHILPFLRELYPGLQFVHVIRDGRDIAFGGRGSRTHTLYLARAILDGDPTPVVHGPSARRAEVKTVLGMPEATPERQILFWNRVNVDCADYAEREMSDSYLRVRLEDLCHSPEATIRRLVGFGGQAVEADAPVAWASSEVQTQTTIGRWKQEPPAVVAQLTQGARDGLQRFGYLS
jgi:hypothetical protein